MVRTVRMVLTCLIVLVFVEPSARAETRRLLVHEFEGGRRARALQDVVVNILSEQKFTVVEVRRVGKDGAAEVDAIATQVDADARVRGRLTRNKRKHFILRVRIADQTVATVDLGRSGTPSKSATKALRRKLVTHLRQLEPLDKPDAAPPPAPEPTPAPELAPELAPAPASPAAPAAPAVAADAKPDEVAPDEEIVVDEIDEVSSTSSSAERELTWRGYFLSRFQQLPPTPERSCTRCWRSKSFRGSSKATSISR